MSGRHSGTTETHSNRCASAKVGEEGTKGHRSVMSGKMMDGMSREILKKRIEFAKSSFFIRCQDFDPISNVVTCVHRPATMSRACWVRDNHICLNYISLPRSQHTKVLRPYHR